MEKKLIAALKRCDACHKYMDLCEAFESGVGGVVEGALQAAPTKMVRDHVTPDECCPDAVRLREFFSSEEVSADDVWLLLYRCAGNLIERQARKRARESDHRLLTTIITNCFVLFYHRGAPNLHGITLRWSFLKAEKEKFEASDAYVNSNAGERRKLLMNSVLCVFSERAHKHYFTTVWMNCIEYAGQASLHVHLLHRLAMVLQFLTNPVVVADYLSGCFSSGGLIAVLALHGLFLLMVDHGLEYPQYYEQLYSLISADSFFSRHRYDLFRLLDLSMTSLRLPAYVAASVVKKVAQVSLSAPAPTLYFTLPLIRKIFQTHPNCLALIHRSTKEAVVPEELREDSSAAALAAKGEALRETAMLFEGKDPFDAQAPLASSHALNSTLWELTALERHYLPAVPLMVSAFASTAEDKTPLRFERTYARLFTSEVTRPLSKDHLPTVAYQEPSQADALDLVKL